MLLLAMIELEKLEIKFKWASGGFKTSEKITLENRKKEKKKKTERNTVSAETANEISCKIFSRHDLFPDGFEITSIVICVDRILFLYFQFSNISIRKNTSNLPRKLQRCSCSSPWNRSCSCCSWSKLILPPLLAGIQKATKFVLQNKEVPLCLN